MATLFEQSHYFTVHLVNISSIYSIFLRGIKFLFEELISSNFTRSMNSAAKGGTDLNMDGGVTDYFKDIIIVTCVVMILSLISDYFW